MSRLLAVTHAQMGDRIWFRLLVLAELVHERPRFVLDEFGNFALPAVNKCSSRFCFLELL